MDGYCTVDDVRKVLQEADLTGALAENDNQLVVDAIAGLQEPIETATHKHWYVEGGLAGDDEGVVPTSAKTRNDEHDIPTHGGFVHGASEDDARRRLRANSDALLEAGRHDVTRRDRYREPKREIRIATGDAFSMRWPRDDGAPAYTRLRLNRKDVTAVNDLMVVNEAGGYDDWTSDKTGGIGNAHRGEDYWVRINNRGVAELYLDVHTMDDDLHTFANAVYVDFEYGDDELPMSVRRGVAQLAAAEIVLDDEAVVSIPDAGQLVNLETKAERWRRHGVEKLRKHLVVDPEEYWPDAT